MFSKAHRASTITIVRESKKIPGQNFEVLLLLRHENNRFVPLNNVFPGGAMDDLDCSDDIVNCCKGLTRTNACNIISDIEEPEIAFGTWITGIRETFEESGLLFAYSGNGDIVSFKKKEEKEKFNNYRKEIYEKKLSFYDMIKREGLIVATDKIFYNSHWITPPFLSIRYDTRFFIAIAPEMQDVMHDGFELTEHIWITPSKALKRHKEGTLKMVLPTVSTIKGLNKFYSIDEIQDRYMK
jgi:hypothetical protein